MIQGSPFTVEGVRVWGLAFRIPVCRVEGTL